MITNNNKPGGSNGLEVGTIFYWKIIIPSYGIAAAA
jgi:hypothetical protein